jgi:uncharacterized protein YndB with AHSA1/START domain/DNA-binding transcriptional ArsR family regulator
MDAVFKALANPSRRAILDELFERDGQSLSALCENVDFSRQGLSGHIQILESAGLVISEFRGREKIHYLNPVPIHEVTERWIAKYSRHQLEAISILKNALEGDPVTNKVFAYETYILAPVDTVWDALTNEKFTSQYFFGTHVESDWQPGSSINYRNSPGGEIAVDGKVLEVDRPNKLVITWHVNYDEQAKKEAPSRVSFSLEQIGEQTKLRIVHDEFQDDSVLFDSISDGWPWIAASLKSLIESGSALPDRKNNAKESTA